MLAKSTIHIQNQLSDYCRNQKIDNIPGVNKGRLPHYKRLIFNIVEDALSSAYPITRDQLGYELWEEIVLDFFENHKCKHPQLFRMPEELIEFCQNRDWVQKSKKPWLLDLLCFEWIEIEVHTMPDVEIDFNKQILSLLNRPLVFNPYLRLLSLNYPVHQLKNREVSDLHGGYYYIVYRESNGTVQYVEVNEFTFNLVSALTGSTISLNEVLLSMKNQFDKTTYLRISNGAVTMLKNLYERGIIIGNR